ncbi:MAG: S-methyl-5'-thioinosine phosphorylase [Actinomycetota bacterium]|nr:S-methyl-5'-thioinosine phosphorylase [Actinomycetota bacterium]
MSALGIIAGTGFYSLESLDSPRELDIPTPFGSARVNVGGLHGRETVFLTRHGSDHSVPPQLINYRANISALLQVGVTEVLSVNVVGGIGLGSGALAVVDDFLDFTKTRPGTFFDGTTPEGVGHADMTQPYDERLRSTLLAAAHTLGIAVEPTGVYAAFEGPRFETRAEIRMAQLLGATVVGMTGVPEVVLAKEKSLPYASLCLVANPAAGFGPEIAIEDVMAVVAQGAQVVGRIIVESARRLANAG